MLVSKYLEFCFFDFNLDPKEKPNKLDAVQKYEKLNGVDVEKFILLEHGEYEGRQCINIYSFKYTIAYGNESTSHFAKYSNTSFK